MGHSPPLHQTGIGVVAPHDFALDRELWRWVPDDVSLHITRMPYAPLRRHHGDGGAHRPTPPLVADGVTDVLAASPMVTAYACTSGSFVGGLAGEAALVAAMIDAGAPSARDNQRRAARRAPSPRPHQDRHRHALHADLTAGCPSSSPKPGSRWSQPPGWG